MKSNGNKQDQYISSEMGSQRYHPFQNAGTILKPRQFNASRLYTPIGCIIVITAPYCMAISFDIHSLYFKQLGEDGIITNRVDIHVFITVHAAFIYSEYLKKNNNTHCVSIIIAIIMLWSNQNGINIS